jgi:hypothetical protein
MNIILTILIHQAPTKQIAPIIAEQLLDFIRANESNIPTFTDNNNNNTTNPFHMKPTFDTYAIVIQAWVESGLPETNRKIDQLLRQYHDSVVSSNESTTGSGAAAATTATPLPSSSSSFFATSKVKNAYANTTPSSLSYPSNCYHSMNGIEGTNLFKPYLMVMQHYSSSQNNSNMMKNIYDMIEGNTVLQSQMNVVILSHILHFVGQKLSDDKLTYDLFTRITQLFQSTNNNLPRNNSPPYRPPHNVDLMVEKVLVATTHTLMNYYRDKFMDISKPSPPPPDVRAEYLRRAQYVHNCAEQYLLFNHRTVGTCPKEIPRSATRDLISDSHVTVVANSHTILFCNCWQYQ